MPYQILDLELSAFLHADGAALRIADDRSGKAVASLRGDVDGIAVVSRWKGEIVGYDLHALDDTARAAGPTISPSQIIGWLHRDVQTRVRRRLLKERLSGALADPICGAPSITVIVCSKDRTVRLLRCIRSIERARDECGAPGDVAILIVDNAPSDASTRDAVSALAGVRYVCEPVPGLNFARNRGLNEAVSEVVAYVDDDVEVDRTWLRALREAWATHPRAGGVSGQVLPLVLDTEARIEFERGGGFRRGFETEWFAYDRDDPNRLFPCISGDFGVGCNMSFRRALVLGLGGFDEALDTGPPLPGGGDHDMLYRVVRSEMPLLYAPSCVVFHEHRETMAQLAAQYWSWGESMMAFVQKAVRTDPPMRARWIRVACLWLLATASRGVVAFARGTILRRPRRHDARLAGHYWQEFAGACVGLFGAYRRSQRRVRLRRERVAG